MKKAYEVIRDLREDKDLKQKDVAEYLEMSRTTYNHYELGHTTLNEDMIVKLAKLYAVTPNVILNYQEKGQVTDIKILKLVKLIEREDIDIDALMSIIKASKNLYKNRRSS